MRTLVIAVYMGPLPSYFRHWMRSCGRNRAIDWLLVTDQVIELGLLPDNVKVKAADLRSLARTFSDHVGFSVLLDRPYKLCDLKPLFFLLADDLATYDYWGFCDIDVIFGDLNILLNRTIGRYDKIGSEGHLMLFRNDPEANAMFRRVTTPYDWRDTLTHEWIGGLDEHHGINVVWAASGRPVFADPAMIADIDPSFRQFRRIPQFRNYAVQAFALDHGKIVREYMAKGRYARDEYIYIHFPRRKMLNRVPDGADNFFIGPAGILPRKPGRSDRAIMGHINPWHWPSRVETMRLVRHYARPLRGMGKQFPRIDTLAKQVPS